MDRKTIEKLADDVMARRGFTIDRWGVRMTGGYAVSVPQFTVRFTTAARRSVIEIVTKMVDCCDLEWRAYTTLWCDIRSLSTTLMWGGSNPNETVAVCIGGWYDEAAEAYELSLSYVFESRSAALVVGRRLGELYIDDLAKYAKGEDGAIPTEEVLHAHTE